MQKRWIAILLSLAVAFAALSACARPLGPSNFPRASGADTPATDPPPAAETTIPPPSAAPTPDTNASALTLAPPRSTETPTAAPPEPTPTVKPAETLALSASYKGIEIVVNSVIEYPGSSIQDDYPDLPSLDKSDSKWILVDLELTNGSDAAVGNVWGFSLRDSDENLQRCAAVIEHFIEEEPASSHPIEPGQSWSGKVLMMTRDECNTYSLVYQPLSGSGDSTVMEIKLR